MNQPAFSPSIAGSGTRALVRARVSSYGLSSKPEDDGFRSCERPMEKTPRCASNPLVDVIKKDLAQVGARLEDAPPRPRRLVRREGSTQSRHET